MRRDTGSALYATIVATIVFVAMTVAMITISLAAKRENEASSQSASRRYLAEAGISDAILELSARNSGAVASAGSPRVFGAGTYFVTATDNGNNTFTVRSTSTVARSTRVLEALLREVSAGAFAHSMYAGNDSGDPTYTLEFGGSGSDADTITGDVYSGNDLSLTGSATVSGTLRAAGTITGGVGETGAYVPVLDIAGMNYPVNNDVDVAAEFSAHGTSSSSALGGTAIQLPETNAAHIFRKNPSDRGTENLGTTKDDYYLEDPYEAVSGANTTDPTAATQVTLAGVGGKPGASGNHLVYFIDGNLWIHNRPAYSFALANGDPGGVQVTFVVRGNVYISDNLLLTDAAQDGIALIAIEDPAETDSGNIYFGDPAFGTLNQMDAFMYAENDFHDNNLNTSGSGTVTINGTMSAGNQIAINRGSLSGQRTKLVMNFDDRVDRGALALPGLPGASATSGPREIQVVSVYEVGGN